MMSRERSSSACRYDPQVAMGRRANGHSGAGSESDAIVGGAQVPRRSPASPESCSADGSMTSGVPEKSRTCGKASGTLIDCLPGCGKDRAHQPVRRTRKAKVPDPTQGARRGHSDGAFSLLVLPMSDVTHILSAIEDGDPHAAEQLLPLVYEELRRLAAQRLAQEKSGQTLQATALVHEAYLRLVDTNREQPWNSRGHFFAAAAEAMRRILVERVRRKGRVRHGGGLRREELLDEEVAAPADDEQLLLLDDALTRLAAARSQAAELVKFRFFAGLTLEEIAPILDLSPRTARRLWAFARAWLRRDMERSGESAS